MRLLTVPPRQGAAWMRQGFAIFVRQPLAFSALFAVFLFVVFVMMLVPVAGPVLLLATLPLVTLGFMVASRHALAGQVPTPAAFVEPLRQGRRHTLALLRLGAVYAAASAAAVTVSSWVDGGALDAAMDALAGSDASAQEVAQRFADPRVELGVVLRLTLAALLSVPFWHAPALVHWGGQGLAQSLFSSTLAIWRNRGAFLVYGLAWAGVVVVFGVVTSLLFALIGQARLGAMALMPASLLFSTAFYASLWFTFADCFGSDAGDETTQHPITTDTP
jgi:hypothetical protein